MLLYNRAPTPADPWLGIALIAIDLKGPEVVAADLFPQLSETEIPRMTAVQKIEFEGNFFLNEKTLTD